MRVWEYRRIRVPEHPRANARGEVYEHRLIAERMIGRYLEPGEEVHHINGDHRDNRPENLRVCVTRWDHQDEHGGNFRRNWPTHCATCAVVMSEQTRGCLTCKRRHKMRRRRERMGMRVCV